jgi:hypothetical protein
MTDHFYEHAKHLGDVVNSLKRQVRWLESANEVQRKHILDLELENARLRGRNQGLETLARAVDPYPLGEYPPLQSLPARPPSRR